MDSLDYKYKHASKQKRIIALQDNRQKPATWLMKYLMRCTIWKGFAKGSLLEQFRTIFRLCVLTNSDTMRP